MQIKVRVKLPWWANLYIRSLNFFANIHGLEPDAEKCAHLLAQHTKIEIE